METEFSLGVLGWIGLSLAILVAFAFEFVNGFHDTANAVATIIYTNSMKAGHAVALSGFCNFLGVFLGGTAVAFTIVHLLPVGLLMDVGTSTGFAMVAALLLSAMTWNLGTWYLGLPASSSHTLIGSIIGVGAANAWLNDAHFGNATTMHAIEKVFLSLLISPFLGGVLAAVLLLCLKRYFGKSSLFHEGHGQGGPRPPKGIRALIIASGMGVSFAHGSNDGQKGIGLIMLILIGMLPSYYAVNLRAGEGHIKECGVAIARVRQMLERKEDIINAQISAVSQSVPGGLKDAMISPLLEIKLNPLIKELHALESGIAGVKSLRDLDSARRAELRLRALSCEDALGDLLGTGRLPLDEGEELDMRRCRDDIMGLVEYSAKWVMLGVAVSLGLGTMVGWRRIVVTIGERIGKSKLNYAQGLSAQFTAAFTILLGVFFGLPVSTTHVLSSGVAGSMLAGGSSLHGRILRSIALAWILTLPVAMLLGGLMYLFLRLFL